MPIARRTLAQLRDVLSTWGLADAAIHDIRSGRVNTHWRVETGAERYALRRYAGHRRIESIAFEHALLWHVEQKGWPVAMALPSRSGSMVVERDGNHFSLFPFLEGRRAPYDSLRHVQRKGAALAVLHADMADWDGPIRRDGVGRVMELDILAQSAGAESFTALLDRYAAVDAAGAAAWRTARAANLRTLVDLDFYPLPLVPVHGDFHTDNMLWRGQELTGLLDFDWAHVDARVADIARSIWLDCAEGPAYEALSPQAVARFIHGYTTLATLTAAEQALILPLVEAGLYWHAAYRLAEWTAGREEALRGVQRTLTRRLPLLRAHWAGLEAAVRAGVR